MMASIHSAQKKWKFLWKTHTYVSNMHHDGLALKVPVNELHRDTEFLWTDAWKSVVMCNRNVPDCKVTFCYIRYYRHYLGQEKQCPLYNVNVGEIHNSNNHTLDQC